jgi:hypothetical protein
MALVFPSASVGQQYQSGSSATYEWNGTYWETVQPSGLAILSASFALTASYVSGSGGGDSLSSSFASSSISASFAQTASNAYNFTVDNNLTVKGILSASFLYADSSSVIFTSGSNTFGTTLTNTQALTGSVGITGSLVLNGSTPANIPNLTGSLFGTASAAISSSKSWAFALG